MTNFIRDKVWQAAAAIKSPPIAAQILRRRQAALRMALFTGTGHIDSTSPGQRASGFTNSTADAQCVIYERLTHLSPNALLIDHLTVSELDRLLRSRAMLLTDNAGDTLGKRQTAILIKPGMTDLELVFLSHPKYLQGPGRADLATESAVEFTITGPGNQIR
jgi:hypothetical protein